MYCGYDDITSKIAEKPQWWDEHAVPRYREFSPRAVANIYAHEVALVEIACQNCGAKFLVTFTWGPYNMGQNENGTHWVKVHEPMTPERIKNLHYGDPPNYGCCGTGATMNCIDLRVVEFWRRGGSEFTEEDPKHPGLGLLCLPGYFDWRRVPELEITLEEETWNVT